MMYIAVLLTPCNFVITSCIIIKIEYEVSRTKKNIAIRILITNVVMRNKIINANYNYVFIDRSRDKKQISQREIFFRQIRKNN